MMWGNIDNYCECMAMVNIYEMNRGGIVEDKEESMTEFFGIEIQGIDRLQIKALLKNAQSNALIKTYVKEVITYDDNSVIECCMDGRGVITNDEELFESRQIIEGSTDCEDLRYSKL